MNDIKSKPMTADAIYNEMQLIMGDAAALLDVLIGLLNEWPIPESEAERNCLGNVLVIASIAQEKTERAQQLSMDFVDAEKAERAAAIMAASGRQALSQPLPRTLTPQGAMSTT